MATRHQRASGQSDTNLIFDSKHKADKFAPSHLHHQAQHQHRQHQQDPSSRLKMSSSSLSPLSLHSTSLTATSTTTDSSEWPRQHDDEDEYELDDETRSSAGSRSPTAANNFNHNHNNNNFAPKTPSPRSPILIKYNYYDYNGTRHEQTNHDINFGNCDNNNKIHRHLSPTFKQSLHEIVRSQSTSQSGSNNKKTIFVNYNQSPHKSSPTNSSSASDSPPPPLQAASPTNLLRTVSGGGHAADQHQSTMSILARRYKLSSYEQRCLRCRKLVYQMDKVGPLKDFTFFHQNCFKCLECGTKLTLKSYFNNQENSSIDLEVYCHRHCPKAPAGRLDNQSVGIRAALNAPKVFDGNQQLFSQLQLQQQQPLGEHQQHFRAHNSYSPLMFAGPALVQQQHQRQGEHQHQQGHAMIDSSAMHIQHAVQQTKLQSIYKQSQVDKKISQFLEKRLEYLEPRQKLLEMRHREEEEQLFKAFELKLAQEESCISEQIRQEWQQELNKLLDKYKRQLSSLTSKPTAALQFDGEDHSSWDHQPHNKQAKQSAQQQQQQKLASHPNNSDQHEQQMIEHERMNLEKTMTIKLDRKKETLKRKLKEFERQATAELVERQSREMLTLIGRKLEEFKEEQKRKIGSDFLEQFEAIESLANQLGASLQLDNGNQRRPSEQDNQDAGRPSKRHQQQANPGKLQAPSPPPKAPETSKMQLYNSEQPDEVFKEIDQLAINVAKEDQQTFTDLVHHLTRNCLSDVEKVRAIFRWITVKNLNTMKFDSTVKPDTPLGLLRGIKQGSESYHVLFKRLCSYAGLHCVVIKGYSKSAGYQPGVRFEGNRFRNSWNAVYVAGAWRFVQCNWGARHLVSVAVMQDNKSNNSSSSRESSNSNNNNGHSPASSTGSRASKSRPSQAVPTSATPPPPPPQPINGGRSQQQLPANGNHHHHHHHGSPLMPNHGRRGLPTTINQLGAGSDGLASGDSTLNSGSAISVPPPPPPMESLSAANGHLLRIISAASSSASSSGSSAASRRSVSSPSANNNNHHHHHSHNHHSHHRHQQPSGNEATATNSGSGNNNNDSLRYEYDDHYFLTDPDEFIYEFFPLASEWQLLKTRPIALNEFEQLPFVRSLFFKYGLYFPQTDIRSVLYADSSGATTIKIGMPTHMVPSLIFHCNLKYFNTDLEHHDGISLKRFVLQSVESGTSDGPNGQILLSNIVSFRVHLPENGAYILDIFANSTTPMQYITGEPMKFKSVCKFKIIAKELKTVMIPLPDCASGEYGPLKATRLFGIIPITHESALIVVQNEKRFLEIQFRMTRPLLDFMASLHKNNLDERQLSKLIKIFIDGDIVFITVKFVEDGQYGLDIYTRDSQMVANSSSSSAHHSNHHHHHSSTMTNNNVEGGGEQQAMKKQLLTHCCKYLINVRGPQASAVMAP